MNFLWNNLWNNTRASESATDHTMEKSHHNQGDETAKALPLERVLVPCPDVIISVLPKSKLPESELSHGESTKEPAEPVVEKPKHQTVQKKVLKKRTKTKEEQQEEFCKAYRLLADSVTRLEEIAKRTENSTLQRLVMDMDLRMVRELPGIVKANGFDFKRCESAYSVKSYVPDALPEKPEQQTVLKKKEEKQEQFCKAYRLLSDCMSSLEEIAKRTGNSTLQRLVWDVDDEVFDELPGILKVNGYDLELERCGRGDGAGFLANILAPMSMKEIRQRKFCEAYQFYNAATSELDNIANRTHNKTLEKLVDKSDILVSEGIRSMARRNGFDYNKCHEVVHAPIGSTPVLIKRKVGPRKSKKEREQDFCEAYKLYYHALIRLQRTAVLTVNKTLQELVDTSDLLIFSRFKDRAMGKGFDSEKCKAAVFCLPRDPMADCPAKRYRQMQMVRRQLQERIRTVEDTAAKNYVDQLVRISREMNDFTELT